MAKKHKVKKKLKSKSKIDAENVPISSLCNVAGLAENEQEDPFGDAYAYSHSQGVNELEDCLAAMDQSLVKDEEKSELSDAHKEDLNDEDDKEESSSSSSSRTIRSGLWKGTGFSSISGKSIPENFALPNLQVELARHKHMGELSKYLLSQCPGMRMPTFERWIMDIKLEEKNKRLLIEERAQRAQIVQDLDAQSHGFQKDEKWKRRMKRKRLQMKTSLEQHMTSSGSRPQNDYDCVIPSMADVEDEASQRLMEEIRQYQINAKDEKKKSKKKLSSSSSDVNELDICRELCRRSCQAARSLQNLSGHLRSMDVNHYFAKSSSSSSMGKIALEEYTSSDETSNDSPSTGPKLYSLVYTYKNKSDHGGGAGGRRKPKPFVVKINSMHYEKMRDMFHSVHDTYSSESSSNTRSMNIPPSSFLLGRNPNQYTPATHIFHHLIFSMLVRYASLSGAQQLLDLRGGGMQGAIHSEVLECISEQKKDNSNGNDTMECFASPLNVYSQKYCSIFHRDLDCHFGSCNEGDFFSLPIGFFRRGGIHEANPPFSPGLMSRMVEQMEMHLSYADGRRKGPGVKEKREESSHLSFVIIVPKCSLQKKGSNTNLVDTHAAPSFKSMLQSRYFSKHIVLNSREHGYIEGSQHLRPTRYKESQYDTSIIILQSEAAKEDEAAEANLTSEEFEEKLRKAFASRHQLELLERREMVSSHQDMKGEESDVIDVSGGKKKRKNESKPAQVVKKKKRKKNKSSGSKKN